MILRLYDQPASEAMAVADRVVASAQSGGGTVADMIEAVAVAGGADVAPRAA